MERRYFNAELRMNNEGETSTMDGYAALYNRMSGDLGGFVEVIDEGFFDDVLNDDVRSLWNHDPSLILGRTKSGTLTIKADNLGLYTKTDLPDTQWGRDAKVSIARGDVSQMSFAFTVKEEGDRWEEKDGRFVRTLLAGGCERLYDISAVTYPAYEDTIVNVRELRSMLNYRASSLPNEATEILEELIQSRQNKESDNWQLLANYRKRQLQLMGGVV